MNEQTEYKFTDNELAYFSKQLQQVNSLMTGVQSAISLVLVQQALPGNWRINDAGTGLQRTDADAATQEAAK